MAFRLRANQKKAAYLLATGQAAYAIARHLNLRAETLSRWKQVPEFIAEIEKCEREELEKMRYKLAHLRDASVEVVWSELRASAYSSKRLTAALGVIKLLGLKEASETPPSSSH